MRRAEQVTEAVASHRRAVLVACVRWPAWVDMLAGVLLTLHDDRSVSRLHVGDVAAFVRPQARGGYPPGTVTPPEPHVRAVVALGVLS